MLDLPQAAQLSIVYICGLEVEDAMEV